MNKTQPILPRHAATDMSAIGRVTDCIQLKLSPMPGVAGLN